MLSAAVPELYKDKINLGVALLCVGSHNVSYIMLVFTLIMNPLNLDFMFFFFTPSTGNSYRWSFIFPDMLINIMI